MSDLGYVIVGGRRLPLTRVRLIRGAVELTWVLCGPCAPFSGPVTVFGEDGRGLWQGGSWELTQPIRAGCTWECRYQLIISAVTEQHVFRFLRARNSGMKLIIEVADGENVTEFLRYMIDRRARLLGFEGVPELIMGVAEKYHDTHIVLAADIVSVAAEMAA